MAETQATPSYFHGVEPRALTPNRYYRVYVLPKELIFIRAGSAGEIAAVASVGFGLIGGLIAAATNPAKKNLSRKAVLDNSNPEQLLGDHKYNFRIRTEELRDARLDPRSFWLASFYSQPTHAGVLRFKHPERGSMRLAIGTQEEMKQAVELLPAAFGGRLIVNATWNEKRKRFVGK